MDIYSGYSWSLASLRVPDRPGYRLHCPIVRASPHRNEQGFEAAEGDRSVDSSAWIITINEPHSHQLLLPGPSHSRAESTAGRANFECESCRVASCQAWKSTFFGGRCLNAPMSS